MIKIFGKTINKVYICGNIRVMRIEIDFEQKMITLKDDCSLGELVEKLKELNMDWKEWKLRAQETLYENYPYIPWTIPSPTYPPYPLPAYPVYCSPTTGDPLPASSYTTCNVSDILAVVN